MGSVLNEDLEQIISERIIPWETMKGSTTLVTGATGTIGSAIIRTLHALNKRYNLDIKVLAQCRNMEKAKSLIGKYGPELLSQDIREPINTDKCPEYIFHCASVTKSSEMAVNPVGVAETALLGTLNILRYAHKCNIKSMVYLSSMEIYGVTNQELSSVRETDLGIIDLKNSRSCYPESKRMCECLCNSYYAQYGVPVKVARLAQTFGAGSAKTDTRVFAQFANSAIAGNDIVLHTEGKSWGNYCYISDAVRALFVLLLKGVDGEAYNISNPDTCMTIRQMAELVSKTIGGNAAVIVDTTVERVVRGYAADVKMKMNIEKIAVLGWTPTYDLEAMYTRMVREWRENAEI